MKPDSLSINDLFVLSGTQKEEEFYDNVFNGKTLSIRPTWGAATITVNEEEYLLFNFPFIKLATRLCTISLPNLD